MRRMFGFLIGVLVGSLVGSTIALLVAPESGEELRDGLRQRSQGFVDQIRTAAQSRRIELQDRLEELKEAREAES